MGLENTIHQHNVKQIAAIMHDNLQKNSLPIDYIYVNNLFIDMPVFSGKIIWLIKHKIYTNTELFLNSYSSTIMLRREF